MLLTGLDDVEEVAGAAGADALLLKPFRPLELLGVVERLAGGMVGTPRAQVGRPLGGGAAAPLRARPPPPRRGRAQAARDARARLPRHGLRARGRPRDEGHRHAASTPTACSATGSSSRSVLDPAYAANPSLEYGFLLHDIGKIGVPEQILQKPGPLERARVAGHAGALAARRPDARRHRVPPGRGPRGDPLAPRALGRRRLPGPAGRRGDPARRAHLRRRRRARRDHEPPALPRGAQLARRRQRDHRAGRQAVRPAGRRRLPRPRARAARDPLRVPRRWPEGVGHGYTRALYSPHSGLLPDGRAAGDPGARAGVRPRRDRAARCGLGPRAPLPGGALREARRARADGRLRARGARRRRRRLHLVHPRARGALARRRRRGRDGRGAHERLHAADPRLRHRRAARALRAAARARRDDRRVRAHRARGRLGRRLAPHRRGARRRRLDDHRREAVDHERQLRGHVPALRAHRPGASRARAASRRSCSTPSTCA